MNHRDEQDSQPIERLHPRRWKRFASIHDALVKALPWTGRAKLALTIPELSASVKPFALAATRVGDRVRIVALNCGEANNRLIGMGFMPNAELEVMSCTATGSMIVALQDQRLGVGADMAQHIHVMQTTLPANSSLPPNPNPPNITQPLSGGPPVKLRHTAIGTTLRVIGYEPTARDYKRKLLAMGLTPGTELRVTRHAPLGDPTEIEVRGYHLSLRKDEADALRVEAAAGVIP